MLLRRSCIKVMLSQEITHRRGKQGFFTFYLPGSSISAKSDNLNSTVPLLRHKVWFNVSVQCLRVELYLYKNIIEDIRNEVRIEGINSLSHRLLNAVQC